MRTVATSFKSLAQLQGVMCLRFCTSVVYVEVALVWLKPRPFTILSVKASCSSVLIRVDSSNILHRMTGEFHCLSRLHSSAGTPLEITILCGTTEDERVILTASYFMSVFLDGHQAVQPFAHFILLGSIRTLLLPQFMTMITHYICWLLLTLTYGHEAAEKWPTLNSVIILFYSWVKKYESSSMPVKYLTSVELQLGWRHF